MTHFLIEMTQNIMKQKRISFLYLFLFLGSVLTAQEIDSTATFQQLITKPLDSRTSIISFNRTFFYIRRQITNEQAADLCLKAIKASEKIQYDTAAYRFSSILSEVYKSDGNYEQSEQSTRQALKYAKACKSKRFMVESYILLGQKLSERDEILAAIDTILLAIEYIDTLEVPQRHLMVAYSNLSTCYILLGETEEAINYQKIIESFYKSGNKKLKNYYLNFAYRDLSNCYQELNLADSNAVYIQRLIEVLEELEKEKKAKDKERHTAVQYDLNLSSSYFHLIHYYLDNNQLAEAKKYYDRSNNLKDYDEIKKYLLDFKYALRNNMLGEVEQLIQHTPPELNKDQNKAYRTLLANYYEQIGDYKNSLAITKKYKDEIIENLKNQKLKLSDYTDSQIESINNKKTIEALEQELALTRLSYGLIALLILTSLLLLYAYRQVKIKNRLLNQNLEDQRTIRSQSAQINQAEKQKIGLFTNIAHELQTPLSIIQGLGKQLTKSSNLDNTDQEAIQIIIRNSRYLSEAAHQMMVINVATTTLNTDRLSLFSLPSLINFIVPEFQFLAKEKNIELVVSNFAEISYLYADVYKLSTILRNLLVNAIKYTQRTGTVQIHCESTEGAFHIFKVLDNGRGIVRTELPNIFDRFFQSESNDAEGGFGLGLAICKDYATSLGGEISVDSQIGQGSSFILKIPKTPESELTNLKEQLSLYQFPVVSTQDPINLEQKQADNLEDLPLLLIVEDNLDYCKYLESILKHSYQLKFTHDGTEAIEYLKIEKPTLIITDWMMQGMDGLKLVKYLKAIKYFNQFPILMLTARSLVSDKIRALRIGIDDYLIKPVDEDILRDRIKYLISSKKEENKKNESSIFPTLDQEKQLEISISDQEWLIQLEKKIIPLISDFDLNVEHVAALNELSIKHLNRKIKEITGLTAKKYIQELRYWEARRMLETGTYKSVKAVCLSVGFKDLKHFSRKFKDRFGQYPKDYLAIYQS